MRKINTLFIMVFLIAFINVHAQANKSINLKDFWTTTIKPFSNHNMKEIKGIVHSPLIGNWNTIIGSKEQSIDLTTDDFYSNYHKIFSEDVIKQINKLNYKSLAVFENRSKNNEVYLVINLEKDSALALSFKEIENQWKLYLIKKVEL